MQVRKSTPDDMTGDGKTSQQRQKLNAWDNSAWTESPWGSWCKRWADSPGSIKFCPLVKEIGGTERCSGDKARWDENQGEFGSREPCCNHRSTTNAQNSRANAYDATQYWHDKAWRCWPVLFSQYLWVQFLFPCRENICWVSRVQIDLPRHSVFSCTKKIPKGQFCSDQDLLSLQDYW